MNCNHCGEEMTIAKTCDGNRDVMFPDGTSLPAVRYFPMYPSVQRCHDCGIVPGGTHHPGCDMERCPQCSGQIIQCGCVPSRLDPVFL